MLGDAKKPAIHNTRAIAATPMVMTGRVAAVDALRDRLPPHPGLLRLAAGRPAAGSQRTEPPASRTQSGQRTPAGVRIWHSGQIVRPHR